MKTLIFDINSIPDIPEDINLCLGYFDGIHKGHFALINEAKKDGKKVGLLTFDKSPFAILHSSMNIDLLSSIEDKKRTLSSLGVDYLFVVKINRDFLSLSKDYFIENVLQKLHPHKLILGEDYHFGKNQEGSFKDLTSKFNVSIVDLLFNEDGKISSTNIRRYILEGDIAKTNECLVYPYSITGIVSHGLENGRKINFPTANVTPNFSYVIPKEGVYCGLAHVNSKTYKALICISTHPTIQELKDNIIEVYIFDFAQNIYDSEIRIEFLHFIRPIIKFETFNNLKLKIECDKKEAIKLLRNI